MKINDHVYFAPDILLKDLKINDKNALLNAFEQRIRKYYLKPISMLNYFKSAFSAGIIEFSMIDALARYSTNNTSVGERIRELIETNFNTSREISERAYEDFRNGLLHENHIKNCGQFCYEMNDSFTMDSGCLIINPLKLQRDLESFFYQFINNLKNDKSLYITFITNIKLDFENEVEFFQDK